MSGVSYQFQDWLVEPDLNQLQNGKIVKPLEPLAMSVLAFLLERSGDVVTTDSLLDELWRGRNAEPGMVARCIAQIRQALDDDAKNPMYIETIRKRGYRTIASVERLPAQSPSPTQPSLSEDDHTELTSRRWPTLVAVALVAMTVAWWGIHQSQKPRLAQIDPHEKPINPVVNNRLYKTIAVLPFTDMSPEGNQGYFGDGVAEELLNELARLDGLRVSGRTSSFSFKGTNSTHDSIAEALGVETILDGSIRKDGNRIRVTAQLISAADGYHLWSQTFDRELEDIFAIQEEIATSVAGALGVRLAVGGINEFKGAGTTNIEAYESYLQGSSLEYNKSDKAIQLFERATQLDPDYSAAWSQWGVKRLSTMWVAHPEEAPEIIAEAYALVERAVKLNPDSAQSNSLLGSVLSAKKDWIGSEEAHSKAISLLSDRLNLANSGLSLMRSGHSSAALEQWKKAEAAEPVGGRLISFRMYVALAQGRLVDARKVLRLFAENQANGGRLVIALNERNAKEIKATIAAMPQTAIATTALYLPVLSVFDSPEQALVKLRKTHSDQDSRWPSKLHDIGILAAYFGDPKFALHILEEEMHNNIVRLQAVWYPVMSEVRKLPEFKTLVTDLNLVNYWRASGWPDLCKPLNEDDFECY